MDERIYDDENLARQISRKSPIHMVLLADNSSSMKGDAATTATEALREWINELFTAARGRLPYFRVTLIVFGSHANVLQGVENVDVVELDPADLELLGDGGVTNMQEALDLACQVLMRDGSSPEACPPFVWLFSDGKPTNMQGRYTNEAAEAAVAAASRLKLLELSCGRPTVVTLGFGNADEPLMERLASSPRLFKKLRSVQDLLELLPGIGTPTVGRGGTMRDYISQIESVEIAIRDR